jgi:hypothetical protein
MALPEQRKAGHSRRAMLGALAGLPIAAGAGITWLRAAGRERPRRSTDACDVFVYGSTPGGIAAAVEAARRGLSVVLACPQNHPGGMAASGLCTTDAVRRHLFGGIVAEFVGKVRAEYVRTLGEHHPDFALIKDGWYYEPSVAERVFADLLAGEGDRICYVRKAHLVSAEVEGGRITSVTLEGGDRISARTYIDGSYEGDLAAAAKVPYVVGREGRDEFGESMAGIHYMNFKTGEQIVTADTGEPSSAIQAFCARCVLTVDPKKRMAIEKPTTYEEHLPDYLPLLEDFASGRIKRWSGGTKFPGDKREFNGNIEWRTSLNLPGVSWSWPEADRHHRGRLAKFHVDHAAGLFWFLQNDSHVPDTIREQMKPLGRHPEEFVDYGGWPWQIYVRQGRRIRGRAIVTQNNFMADPKTGKTPTVEQPIALGEHSFDVHPCHDRRFAVEGFMEGVLWYPKKAFGPAQPGQIPWGALLPQKVDNLLVPVALSCTHVAMSVLRMEPVWMTLGQIAGLAAAVAKETKIDVASIDPELLPVALKIPTVPTEASP